MDNLRIAELLRPIAGDAVVSPAILEQSRLYLDLLLRWNARINLTAVRDPEEMVARHFGESLLAARILFPQTGDSKSCSVCDVGSGAGFPGIPIKLWAPDTELTLIESQNKKVTFLREVLRALKLDGAHVFAGRAEDWVKTAGLVTLRAVEKFDTVLPVATRLVEPGGRLCVLIGSSQFETARKLLRETWSWDEPHPIPQSTQRVVAVAHHS